MKGHGQTSYTPSNILPICLFISSSNRGKRRYNIGFTVLPVFGHVYLSVLNLTDMYFWAGCGIGFVTILNKMPLIWISLLPEPLNPSNRLSMNLHVAMPLSL